MKHFLVILLFCIAGLYALDGFDYYRKKIDECLSENKLSEYDLKYVFGIGKPNYEEPENISEKTLACMLSCMYHLYKKPLSLDKTIALEIKEDDDLTASEQDELLVTLKNCTQEAGKDDCELLYCLEATREPFSKIITHGKKLSSDKTAKLD